MDDLDNKLFASFERSQEFLDTLSVFLSSDLTQDPSPEQDRNEAKALLQLTHILNEYQEQSYLLDPTLEKMVTPTVDVLRAHAQELVFGTHKHVSKIRLERLSWLIYHYIKCRGYKAIVRFFPHRVSDLSIALEYMLLPDGPTMDRPQWPLRFAILLWLSLICMIPFDLSRFDEEGAGETVAQKIENIGKSFLPNAGLERDGAALLLAKFYMRKDTLSRFPTFLQWAEDKIQASDVFLSLGSTQVLCEIMKSGGVDQLLPYISSIHSLTRRLTSNSTLLSNTLLRKLKTKLVSRITLKLLPSKRQVRRQGRLLDGGTLQPDTNEEEEPQINIPEEVEGVIGELLESLQDKDTAVRWSAAKGLSRISERLPAYFSNQVLDMVLSLFSVHSIIDTDNQVDLPAAAENTWHGACLASAEFARRGLATGEQLAGLIGWMFKALSFDIRKGAHSIGSSVRDAASYVLWALARTQDSHALEPYASDLARKLVLTALYDREVHIRRAASAAFQENVGRMGLFPHGIDVLRKTDFYAISIRRNAFTLAAPQVAEHEEYRGSLIDHLLGVTLKHWDPVMRTLGAQSLRLVCQIELAELGPQAASRAARMLTSADANEIHGALMALAELAFAFADAGLEAQRTEIFKFLLTIPSATFQKYRNELILEASSYLIRTSMSQATLALDNSETPPWKSIVEQSLRHRSESVQEAGANAMAAVSRLECGNLTYVTQFGQSTPVFQQSLALLLGRFAYGIYPSGVKEALHCLLDAVRVPSSIKVETRRNCYDSLAEILDSLGPKLFTVLDPVLVQTVYKTLIQGLDDYSVDQRGDVGSWVRIACIKGLVSASLVLFKNGATASIDASDLEKWFPVQIFHEAFAAMLKQGVERLDSVRGEAGEQITKLLNFWTSDELAEPLRERWQLPSLNILQELFLGSEAQRWSDGNWLFPRAVKLLHVPNYRHAVLNGLIMSVGSKTESTNRPLSKSLSDFVDTLSITSTSSSEYSIYELTEDLASLARKNLTSNNVVLPILQTLDLLLEAGVARKLVEMGRDGLKPLQVVLQFTGKGASRLKNVQRILASMRIVVQLIVTDDISEEAVNCLPSFLGHSFPKVRADTAECLYLAIQTHDMGNAEADLEEILLGTPWLTDENLEATIEKVVALLKQS